MPTAIECNLRHKDILVKADGNLLHSRIIPEVLARATRSERGPSLVTTRPRDC